MSRIELVANAEDHRIARLAAAAIGLACLDAAIPSPLPGVKPGFANIVTLIALDRYGWRTAAWVAGLRVVASSLLFGQLLTPGFFLGAAGALASLLVLAPWSRLPRQWFGPVSASLLAALAHIGAQWLVARYWLVPSPGLIYLLPPLASAALLSGLVNGLIAAAWLARHPCSETAA
ncbi:Gx transporter family protein [Chitinimonas lacunae]|uniref:Gx transporter family protein n=1 Tax=Chitinimonas lacunae TaxID=1963018 RepID=A0ABV8MQP4_9NEIS